jgi:plasmid stability protein
MSEVLVGDLDARTVERLKQRARRHGRSLQTELKDILERAAGQSLPEARALAFRIRRRLAGRRHSDSAALLAADRTR